MDGRPIDGVLETCLYVDALEKAERFYRETLGLQFVSRRAGRHVFFRVGGSMLLIFDPQQAAAASSRLPPHGAAGPGHVAFSVPQRDLPAWQAHLEAEGVEIEQIVTWPNGAQSVYFRDPAGNSLELASPSIWGIGGGADRSEAKDTPRAEVDSAGDAGDPSG